MDKIPYHPLLQRQIREVPPEYLEDKTNLDLLAKVSDSYALFERDKAISEHAFAISEKEYREVNRYLQEQTAMNGYEATCKIRQIERETGNHVRIIGLTANAMNGDREKCINAGMDDYISKPVRMQKLMDVISRVGKTKFPSREIKNEAGSPPVDYKYLIEKLGDRDEVSKCLELFEIELSPLLKVMDLKIRDRDQEALKEICHDLRGMLVTMEMHTADCIIQQMQMFISNDLLEDVGDLFSSLKSEITESISYLKAL